MRVGPWLKITCRNLSFIAISKDPNFDREKAMIDFNVGMLRETLLKVLDYV